MLTFDRNPGDGGVADILVHGDTIEAVAPGLMADAAEVIDARGAIVMPGFVDSHRHLWQSLFRNAIPNASLDEYFRIVSRSFGPLFTPDDVYAATLLSAVGAMDAGITSLLDWASIQNSPEHTSASIQALRDSGIRAVFAYGNPALGHPRYWEGGAHEYPSGIRRIRRDLIPSDDGLVTLAFASIGGPADRVAEVWNAAREAGVPITIHAGAGAHNRGVVGALGRSGRLKDDTTYIHCCYLADDEWAMIRDTGGTVSLSPWVEMSMGIGPPPVQKALDTGIRPSLSIDVETSAPGDMFTQMRTVLALQRSGAWQRQAAGDRNAPQPLAARDVLEFATIEGARALHLSDRVGVLAPGMQADVIVLRADGAGVAPLNNAEGAVVTSMQTAQVETVIIAGRIAKRGGRPVGPMHEKAVALAQTALERLREAAGLNPALEVWQLS